MLDVGLGPDQARALGGFLAERPLVHIGDSWRGMSLLNLADLGQIAIDGLAPVRVALNLPWGRWVTIVEPPDDAGNTPRLVFPDGVGLPPVRNSLRGTVLQPETEAFEKIRYWKTAFALAVTTTEPAELHVGTGDLASRLLSGDDRTDDWPALYGTDKEMPGGPNLYRDDELMEADWPIGKLDVGSSRTSLFFPMSYPNLAFDDRIAPRIEPLSVSTSPLWDLLVSAGRLEARALGPGGVARIWKSGDPLLMLAGMYGCYLNGFDEALDHLQRFFREESEHPDVVILRHAYAMSSRAPRRLRSCRQTFAPRSLPLLRPTAGYRCSSGAWALARPLPNTSTCPRWRRSSNELRIGCLPRRSGRCGTATRREAHGRRQ